MSSGEERIIRSAPDPRSRQALGLRESAVEAANIAGWPPQIIEIFETMPEEMLASLYEEALSRNISPIPSRNSEFQLIELMLDEKGDAHRRETVAQFKPIDVELAVLQAFKQAGDLEFQVKQAADKLAQLKEESKMRDSRHFDTQLELKFLIWDSVPETRGLNDISLIERKVEENEPFIEITFGESSQVRIKGGLMEQFWALYEKDMEDVKWLNQYELGKEVEDLKYQALAKPEMLPLLRRRAVETLAHYHPDLLAKFKSGLVRVRVSSSADELPVFEEWTQTVVKSDKLNHPELTALAGLEGLMEYYEQQALAEEAKRAKGQQPAAQATPEPAPAETAPKKPAPAMKRPKPRSLSKKKGSPKKK